MTVDVQGASRVLRVSYNYDVTIILVQVVLRTYTVYGKHYYHSQYIRYSSTWCKVYPTY